MEPSSNTVPSGTDSVLPQPVTPLVQHGIQILFQSCGLSSPYFHNSELKFRRARAAVATISLNHCVICIAARHLREDHRYYLIETIYDKSFAANWDLSIDERIREVKWGRIRQAPEEFACLRFDRDDDLWQFAESFKQALSIVQRARAVVIQGMSHVHASLYNRRLNRLNMSITGYTAVQCTALEKEYGERVSVQDKAEALLNESGALIFSVNEPTQDIDVAPIEFSLDGFYPLFSALDSPTSTYFDPSCTFQDDSGNLNLL